MSAEAATPRQQHARALLDALHPAQFGALPAPLLDAARDSALGRRLLARMALRRAPSVFAPDQERWQNWHIEDEAWLAWPQARLQSFSRTLGAIALGPALRTHVERQAVLFLREVLGADWRQAQLATPWPGAAPDTVRQMGIAVLQRCGRDAAMLSAAVHERGLIEFLAHAERRSAELAARLALSYAKIPPTPCSRENWLPPGTVAVLLAAETARDNALGEPATTESRQP